MERQENVKRTEGRAVVHRAVQQVALQYLASIRHGFDIGTGLQQHRHNLVVTVVRSQVQRSLMIQLRAARCPTTVASTHPFVPFLSVNVNIGLHKPLRYGDGAFTSSVVECSLHVATPDQRRSHRHKTRHQPIQWSLSRGHSHVLLPAQWRRQCVRCRPPTAVQCAERLGQVGAIIKSIQHTQGSQPHLVAVSGITVDLGLYETSNELYTSFLCCSQQCLRHHACGITSRATHRVDVYCSPSPSSACPTPSS